MLSQVLAGYFATHTQRLLGVIRDRFGQHDVAAQSCNAPRLVGSMIAGREGQDPRDHLVGAAEQWHADAERLHGLAAVVTRTAMRCKNRRLAQPLVAPAVSPAI